LSKNKEKIFIDKLMIINCYYNYVIEYDGKCYSNTCGFNVDKEIAEQIQQTGCMFYENSIVKQKRETEGERNN